MKKHKQINLDYQGIGFNVYTLDKLDHNYTKLTSVVDEFLYKELKPRSIRNIMKRFLKY